MHIKYYLNPGDFGRPGMVIVKDEAVQHPDNGKAGALVFFPATGRFAVLAAGELTQCPQAWAMRQSGFAERMRERRQALGMTHQALADASMSTLRTIENYEGGQRTPRQAQLVMLAQALGTTTTWLITGKEEGNGHA